MKFSLEWMREYVDPGKDPAAAGIRLTQVGIPLDSLGRAGDDTVFDFDVSTNRPDCMNHVGLARELSVACRRPLAEPSAETGPRDAAPASSRAALEVEAPDLCGRYTAIVIRGVKVGPSPDWLSRRLAAIGQKPINAIVDATNYVLWEMGQPLHAFDLERLAGRKVRVRRARSGEPLTTLDGVSRKLDPETLVIADEQRAVAVAGVMGGLDSEISPATTEVLLESAHFDAVSVRRSARRLGLHTDASHRFERGADIEITLKAANRCAGLIRETAGGRILSACLESRAAPPFAREIAFRPDRVGRMLGVEIPVEEMRRILELLGCAVKSRDSLWLVSTPSFRVDLSLEEDLIEEIARHHGYEKIPATLPRAQVFPEGRSEAERRLGRVREAMVRCGFAEALNLSLVSAEENERLGEAGPGVRVTNPLTEGQDHLRTTLFPGLLRNLAHNLNHGAEEVRLFETGRVFHPGAPGDPPREIETLALIGGGQGTSSHWSEPSRGPDVFDLTGAVNLAARLTGIGATVWRGADRPFLRPGTGAVLEVDGKPCGHAGELLASAFAGLAPQHPVVAAEIRLPAFFAGLAAGWIPGHVSSSRTPSARRDLALILDRGHTYAEVEETIRSVEGAPIAKVTLFDLYQGRQVPEGKVSMAVNIVFQAPERTLVSGEVAAMMDRIVQRLRDRLGAVLRGN
ncbi:MAG TPA: phenylalanine--tRNA ligase subunit beta [Candidatus Polarisedimenticolia bacterium]|nr:phenylalanine--tRNA ligase subunit beta [Candidatus Polarisedimenticolia bacterium]